ncbi:hypothetical protein HD595_000142 [Nonomuraea roseoviolacea subsp. carminata]|uniref:Resolvase/invertase-type recombinase catalytic domain-containing protein n=1 Tax=Nonomuraea roseoviolacea subsp. carminata TaxID=160689 RepID=A0ABT1JR26_9ACTN|nr:recombinase family protein [Nonomuraea roseoviolacea]MCP2344020.1 hypothetical protein [Nonomuraea roseoviolacea subsp. carminata]
MASNRSPDAITVMLSDLSLRGGGAGKGRMASNPGSYEPRGINLHILSGTWAGIHRPNGQSIADKMLFMVAAMAAEIERDLIQERTLDGLAATRAAGRTGPIAVTDGVLAAAGPAAPAGSPSPRSRASSAWAAPRCIGRWRTTSRPS